MSYSVVCPLQEKAGVKMVMIQDSNVPSHQEKPLRITGEPQKCQVQLEKHFHITWKIS